MTNDNLTLEHRGVWQHTRSPEGISSIQSEQQVIYKLLCPPPAEKNLLDEEVHEQAGVCKNKAWIVAPCKKRVVFDTAVQHFSGESVGCKSRQGPTRATHREPENDFCCKEPLLSSSPVLEIKSCDSEEEFNVHCTKKRREYRAESTHGLVEEACNSQDLFLTQKTFLPSGSSDDSVSSPSAKRDKYTECQKTTGLIKHTRTSEVNLPCLRSSPIRQRYENYGLVSSRKLGPITEKATQTDDFFSSRALATSLGFYKTQRDNKCTEKPVDLSLPSGMRAKITSHRASHCHVNGEGDGVHISPKYVLCRTSNCIPILGDENPTNCLNTFCRLSEDGKYIQTRLNESYFFKLKGESPSPESQAPLMKEKVMREKKQATSE
ncbi:hypothetical protein AOXY_G19329 [Acipenser oxyrinchus oxyrinchus]|uniref:Uncharacterized protein n=1 Tax=Acipenser oxyrinchus oxyrinchus TaxID=40147 RepID=A0AAD8D3B2_ACIOX|nr:hypothetical protein AOXY_G19329 [Acipenser oxyrinchus oxyrinchus]